MSSPKIQDILRDQLPDILARRPFCLRVTSIIKHMAQCRTGELGYHYTRCTDDECDGERLIPNSCLDRNCRCCAGPRIDKWVQRAREHILPVDHCQVVFAMHPKLVPLWSFNQKVMSSILVNAGWTSIQKLLRKKKFCGAEAGATAFLHFWNHRLDRHVHGHFQVTWGGLGDDGKWHDAKLDRLLPFKLLASMFRSTFINMTREALRKGKLQLPPSTSEHDLRALLVELEKDYWHVHTAKRGSSEHLLKYGAAYMTGGPIGNRRLVRRRNGKITISVRTPRNRRATKGPKEQVTMPEPEFVERIASHIPDKGVHMVRHFGIYASAKSNARLRAARALFGLKPVERHKFVPPVRERPEGCNSDRCPKCNALMRPMVGPFTTGPPGSHVFVRSAA